jgi:phage terminase Nu1 subunit (DNA packaging protein)
MTCVSLSEYARLRSVSAPRISALRKAGRLVMTPDNRVDVERSDELIARTSTRRAAGLPVLVGDDDPEARRKIMTARARREHHEANLAAMREQEKAGNLVEADRVKKAAVDAGALLRGALEQLPGKLGARLAAETDAAACRDLLRVEIDAALADLADGLAALAARGGQTCNDGGNPDE